MGEKLRHEEVVERFAGSGAVDFKALGEFVAGTGSALADSDGLYGALIGRPIVLACFLRPDEAAKLIDGLAGYAALGSALRLSAEQ